MYKIDFVISDYLESKRFDIDYPDGIARPEGYTGQTSLECISFFPVGNRLYCELASGMIFTIPANSFIGFTHVDDTAVYHECEGGGYLYHQYDHETKNPTGFATGDPSYLCRWLMDGYDVVIEASDEYGYTSHNYITTSIEK